ncbi:MAG: hypothetical protein J6T26_01155 [Firmicutes bacterium]|nr:hypothetical protein [Bacillota bacterium]
MTGFKRGSTPVNTFDVDIDLTGATVFITYNQGEETVLEKAGADVAITPTQLAVTLTQEETLAFTAADVDIQIRYVFPSGAADGSDIIHTTAERILKDGVITP